MHPFKPPNPSQSPSPQPSKLKKQVKKSVQIKKATQNDDFFLPNSLPDPTNYQKNIKATGTVQQEKYVQNVEIGAKGQMIGGKQSESDNLVKLSTEEKLGKIDNLSVGEPEYRIQKNGIQYNEQENLKKTVNTSCNNLQSAPKLSRLKFQKSARRNPIINTIKSHSPQPFEPPKKHSKIIANTEKITQRQPSLIQIQAEIQIAARAKALLGLSGFDQNLQQNFSVKKEEDQPKPNVISEQKQEEKQKQKQEQKQIQKEKVKQKEDVKQKSKQNSKDNNKESNQLNFSFSKEIGYGKEQISAQLQVYKDFNQNFQSNSLGRYEEQINDELIRQSSGEQAYGRKFKIKSQIRQEIEKSQKESALENERKFYKKRDFRKNINKKRLSKEDKKFMIARRPVVLDSQIYDSDQEQLKKKINKQKQQNKLNQKQPNLQQNKELKISSFEQPNSVQLIQIVSYQIPELPNPKISLLQPQIHQQEFSQLILPKLQPILQQQFENGNKKYPSSSAHPQSQQEILEKLEKIFKELDGIATRVSMIEVVVANQMIENRKQRQKRRESTEKKDRKDDNRPKKIRRKASEINRKYVCHVGRCRKSYGTSSSLKNHVNRKHVFEERLEVQKVGKSFWLKGQFRQPKKKLSKKVQKMVLNKIQQQEISEESDERIDQILKREQSQRIQEQKIEEEIYYSDQDDQMYENQDDSEGYQSGSSSSESIFQGEEEQEQGKEKAKREAMKD